MCSGLMWLTFGFRWSLLYFILNDYLLNHLLSNPLLGSGGIPTPKLLEVA